MPPEPAARFEHVSHLKVENASSCHRLELDFGTSHNTPFGSGVQKKSRQAGGHERMRL
jgi:hypothetical protein